MEYGKNSPLTYSSYLKITELINLQKPLSQPAAHDELLFIITHQTYELWFKQVIFELESIIENLQHNQLIPAFRLLNRICEIFRVLVQQIDILETMTPTDFNDFRAKLNPASGFQSIQFREFEILSGADLHEYEKLESLNPEWKISIQKRKAQKNLPQTFHSVLQTRGLVQKESDIPDAIKRIYLEKDLYDLRELCEGLIRYDEQLVLWRFRHVQMVERMIGMKRGTGGSSGVSYLQSTLKTKYFPELWAVRTEM